MFAWLRTTTITFVLLALMRTARADGVSEPEGSLRVGGALMDYSNSGVECNVPDFNGTGWFVDGELGWRYHAWTVSAFGSYVSHRDRGNPGGMSGNWDVLIRVVEVGIRATWHHGPLSVGLGAMPFVRGQQSGFETFVPDGEPSLMTFPQSELDFMTGVEAHVGFDLTHIERMRVQAFALVEYAWAGFPESYSYGWNLASGRLGIGLTY